MTQGKRYTNTSRERERTRPHRDLEHLLSEMELSHLSEVPVAGYVLDIYLTEWHLAIEVDGPTHTTYSLRDRARDKRLLDVGIPTLRIKANYVKTPGTRAAIETFIVAEAPTTKERKAKCQGLMT